MKRIGYARVSSTGQTLDVQLDKLKKAGCDLIYQEKRSGKTAARPQFQECMKYIRDGDTLVVTRLDRLARSVVHLAQISTRFEKERINLAVLDQNLDTSTSTGRLMFNMLAAIAEFENDLRSERQADGIAKAREQGVRFGRPPKINEPKRLEIYSRRAAGATIKQIAREFRIGEASVYRALNTVKQSGAPPQLKTTKIMLWLCVENNSKFVRGKGKTRKNIEDYLLSEYSARKPDKDGWEYELTFQYEDDADLESQIDELVSEMHHEADIRHGFIECSFSEVGTDRQWY